MSEPDERTAVCDLSVQEAGWPRVLVGDNDSRFKSELTARLNKEYNVRLEHANTAEMLVLKAQSGHFDLIITDGIYEGGVYDGIAAIAAMRAQRNMTPMVMLTSCASTDVRINVEKYPLAHVVEKGNREELTTVLNGYLSAHKR